MRILAIETSCDETGASVVERKDNEQFAKVLSNITASSMTLHAKTGGIIPEFAAREQIKAIVPLIIRALLESEKIRFNLNQPRRRLNLNELNEAVFKQANFILRKKIDAIAVTHGPGLIGSLLVGVETAKTLSFALNKPIVPVHHLLAHLFANFIQDAKSKIQYPNFPFIGLIVSGGHTDLLLFKSISKFKWLGGTRDDAAGEALDKIGRLLGLSYPAGPEIERRAYKIKDLKSNIRFQSPLINAEDFDFSFSGLKTEVARFIQTQKHLQDDPMGSSSRLKERLKNEVCYAVQRAIFSVLIKKTIRAAKLYNCDNILLGGGVASNQTLLKNLKLEIRNLKLDIKVFAPPKIYTTDNAAMIGAHALLNFKPISWGKIIAEPDLYFD